MKSLRVRAPPVSMRIATILLICVVASAVLTLGHIYVTNSNLYLAFIVTVVAVFVVIVEMLK